MSGARESSAVALTASSANPSAILADDMCGRRRDHKHVGAVRHNDVSDGRIRQ